MDFSDSTKKMVVSGKNVTYTYSPPHGMARAFPSRMSLFPQCCSDFRMRSEPSVPGIHQARRNPHPSEEPVPTREIVSCFDLTCWASCPHGISVSRRRFPSSEGTYLCSVPGASVCPEQVNNQGPVAPLSFSRRRQAIPGAPGSALSGIPSHSGAGSSR
jgi:hypothetical protein